MSKDAAVRQMKGTWSPGKPCASLHRGEDTAAPGGARDEGACPRILPSHLARENDIPFHSEVPSPEPACCSLVDKRRGLSEPDQAWKASQDMPRKFLTSLP